MAARCQSRKICGLSTPETLDAAVRGGARHIGFVFFPPSPRNLSRERAAQLAARAPEYVMRVGAFVDPDDALEASIGTRASILVLGRPITQAENPDTAVREIEATL